VAHLQMTLGEGESSSSVAESGMRALNVLAGQTYQAWQCLLLHAERCSDPLTTTLSDAFLAARAERFGESVFRETRLFAQRAYMPQGERGVEAQAIASALRSSTYFRSLPAEGVQDLGMRSDDQPVLIEQWHATERDEEGGEEGGAEAVTDATATPDAERSARKPHLNGYPAPTPAELPRLGLSWMERRNKHSSAGIHLYVFVHGFHGNAFDLRGLRNQMALLLPDKANARFLMSCSNESHTASASFERLGINLAREVVSYIRSEQLGDSISRISFICHSFGAVICRSALRESELQPLLPRLHTYCSFSGPHLGMLYSSNMLVELGIWGLRKWKHAQCLTELSLKDAKQPSSCFLYRLSKDSALSHFANVLLVSSAEDRYVPHHSARIQLCAEAMHDPRYGTAFVSMVHNLLAPLTCANMLHIDVCFPSVPSTRLAAQLDDAIGRSAHIAFLEKSDFINMFAQMYLQYLV